MVITDKQLLANRRNAGKSTGPKSPAGKAVVKLNAVTHGLLSKTLILPDEKLDDAAEFERQLRASLLPVGPVEELLAERIILCAWRHRRLARIETKAMENDWKDYNGKVKGIGYAFWRNLKSLPVLSRYETALERGLYKALHELQRLQAARAGALVPLPVVVDVSLDAG